MERHIAIALLCLILVMAANSCPKTEVQDGTSGGVKIESPPKVPSDMPLSFIAFPEGATKYRLPLRYPGDNELAYSRCFITNSEYPTWEIGFNIDGSFNDVEEFYDILLAKENYFKQYRSLPAHVDRDDFRRRSYWSADGKYGIDVTYQNSTTCDVDGYQIQIIDRPMDMDGDYIKEWYKPLQETP